MRMGRAAIRDRLVGTVPRRSWRRRAASGGGAVLVGGSIRSRRVYESVRRVRQRREERHRCLAAYEGLPSRRAVRTPAASPSAPLAARCRLATLPNPPPPAFTRQLHGCQLRDRWSRHCRRRRPPRQHAPPSARASATPSGVDDSGSCRCRRRRRRCRYSQRWGPPDAGALRGAIVPAFGVVVVGTAPLRLPAGGGVPSGLSRRLAVPYSHRLRCLVRGCHHDLAEITDFVMVPPLARPWGGQCLWCRR